MFQPLHEVIATDELEAGFRRLEQAVAADPGARRLQILRPCSCSNGASAVAGNRYIIWRNRHADDTRLPQVVARANLA